MPWQWMSFADPDLPEGTQFLGCAIVEAEDVVQAATVAHLLGINPGGEVLCAEIPPHLVPASEWRNVLLSKAKAEELAAWMDARS